MSSVSPQPAPSGRPPGRMADGSPIHVPQFAESPDDLGADVHERILAMVVNEEPLPKDAPPAEQALYAEIQAEFQEAQKHPNFEVAIPHEGRALRPKKQ